ncbi:MAG: SPOR domain-containing protein [Syntrophales bacterium]|nr:SPOR domain-containing protein [Syntrophales bacterium]
MTAKNLRQFEFKLGKLGVVLFITGLSILVFVSFILGVHFGRNIDTSPDMIARGIPGKLMNFMGLSPPAIRPEIPAGMIVQDPGDGAAGAGQSAKAGEVESKPAVVAAPSPESSAASPKEIPVGPDAASSEKPPVSPAKAAPAAVAAAPQTKTPGTETKTPEKALKPAERAKANSTAAKNGKYTVQVVSYREKEKAEILSKKIRELGYTPQVSMTEVPGKGQWYRVTIEGFEAKPAAEKAAENMTKKIKGISCVIRSK